VPSTIAAHSVSRKKLPIGREVVAADDPRYASPRYRWRTFEPRESSMWNQVKRSAQGRGNTNSTSHGRARGAPSRQFPCTLVAARPLATARKQGPKAEAAFLHRLHHLSVTDRQPKNVGQEPAGSSPPTCGKPLLIGHQRRQSWPEQPRRRTSGGSGAANTWPVRRFFIQSGAMLGDDVGLLDQLDLLDNVKAIKCLPACGHILHS